MYAVSVGFMHRSAFPSDVRYGEDAYLERTAQP